MLLFSAVSDLYSQETDQAKKGMTKIQIIHADDMRQNIAVDPDLTRLLGNLKLKHEDIFMYCDSAYHYKTKNQVKAYSKVRIQQGDTLNLYGDYLFYDGIAGNAFMKGNVVLIDKDTYLYTDSINYDVRNKIARYDDRGRITNGHNNLTSIIGVYNTAIHVFHFKDSVRVTNPEYVMTGDTMDYNTVTKISYFTGPTVLKGDSLNVFCRKGWYDTQNKTTSLWKDARIDNMKQIIHGDSLFYNDSLGFGESFRNVIIEDTTQHIAIEGDYVWYKKIPEKFLATKKAVFVQISDKDSLFLHADTISSVTKIFVRSKLSTDKASEKSSHDNNVKKAVDQKTSDSLKTAPPDSARILNTVITDSGKPQNIVREDSSKTVPIISHKNSTKGTVEKLELPDSLYRLVRAFHNCRIFRKDMQAKCDSMSYSFQDSVIRLYRNPVLWANENQLTSDSMAVFTKNQQTDHLELYNAAFITSKVDSIRYNQIKGRSLTGYFKHNELYKIYIRGNGETLYYLIDGDDVAGVNQSKCASIEVMVEKGKVTEIYEHDNPDGYIDPPLPPTVIRLDGFKWLDDLRPKKKEDIFK